MGAAVDVDYAGVGRMDASQDLYERAFAGAVCAEKRMDLAAADCEIQLRAGPRRVHTILLL